MRLGIISDIHENAEKLGSALRVADANRCDELVCLGDIAGYDIRFYKYDSTRSAKKCLDLIRSNFRWTVAGNHDLFAARQLPHYSDGFIYPEEWFNMNPMKRKEISSGRVWCYEGDLPGDLDEEDQAFLKDLPEFIITSEPGVGCLFSHYIFPDFTGSTTRYVEKNYQLRDLWRFMGENEVCFSFSGHSHTLFTGFAYKGGGRRAESFLKAINSIPSDNFNLGNETLLVLLPPLSGEPGKTGFTIFDTENRQLRIISLR
ncbi:MAG: metallophosphoesterase [Bacteroidales bacterium]|jgi:predicted phosphodiesterase|nr:metallophosphoesterase [Bacteroidales bacterium]